MIPKNVTFELRLVLQVIEDALAGRAPLPEIIAANASAIRDAVPEHVSIVRHFSKAELGLRRARYQIIIKGRRVDGVWNFTPGELAKLVREISNP